LLGHQASPETQNFSQSAHLIPATRTLLQPRIGAAKLWRHRSANTATLLASAGATDTLGRLARC